MLTPVKAEYTYREFRDYARRFNQVEMLEGIARIAADLPESRSFAAHTCTLPWALAALARASILYGNPYRNAPVLPKDVTFGCMIYNNIAPSEPNDPAPETAFNLMIRTAHEQFPLQESTYEELARTDAFFNGYSGGKVLEVLDEAGISELLGAPVRQAVGVAVLLYASATQFDGFFEPPIIDREDFAPMLERLPREQILSVIDACFVGDFADFKEQAALAPVLPNLERYMFNPLNARPLLRLDADRLLAPVPQLILLRLSPSELYFKGLARWGVAFTRDMGELFENYIGRQLQTLPNATVYSEIAYGGKQGQEKKSIDWIVVFDDLVLLVECKATRLIAEARAGGATTQATIAKTLSNAFTQIHKTRRAILDGVQQFSHIPADRPFLGLVTTLDPWYLADIGARDFLDQPQVSTLIGSARSVKSLVAIGQRRSASEVLMHTADHREVSIWNLSTVSRFREPGDTNPILDTAWESYPFYKRSAGPDPV